MKRCRLVHLAVVLAFAAQAEEAPWETVLKGPITIKNRAIPGTPIKAVWAEGDIAAPVQDLQTTLLAVERFRYFMPFLKEARQVGGDRPDGSRLIYTLIDLPLVGKRDYVERVSVVQWVKPDGSGAFEDTWSAEPDRLPRTPDVVRLLKNDGGWRVTPIGDGSKSHVVYTFAVDPGGWVPPFAANLGNQEGVAETFRVVEKEAQRRRDERLARVAKAR